MIVVHQLPPFLRYMAVAEVDESLVKVQSLKVEGKKDAEAIKVVLNNTDTVEHTVNVFVTVGDAAGGEVAKGELLNEVMPTTTKTLTIDVTPDIPMKDVATVHVTVDELS